MTKDERHAYNICASHQPHKWEGDGTCVVCEAQRFWDALNAIMDLVLTSRAAYAVAIKCVLERSDAFPSFNMEATAAAIRRLKKRSKQPRQSGAARRRRKGH